jgi:hypothetical protein
MISKKSFEKGSNLKVRTILTALEGKVHGV